MKISKNRIIMNYFTHLDDRNKKQLESIKDNFMFVVKNVMYEFYTVYSREEFLHNNIVVKYNLRMRKFAEIPEFKIDFVLDRIEDEDFNFLTKYEYNYPLTFSLFHLIDVFYYLFSYLIIEKKNVENEGKWSKLFDYKNLERINDLLKMCHSIYNSFIVKLFDEIDKTLKLLTDDKIDIIKKQENKLVNFCKINLLKKENYLNLDDIDIIIEDLILFKQFVKTPEI